MLNVLILGGTKYVGLKYFNILKANNFNIYVASRNNNSSQNFIQIDRKNSFDLENIFKRIEFDVVVDFINYSSSDCAVLLNSLALQKKPPRLILISTTYVYESPLSIQRHSLFREINFDPFNHNIKSIDSHKISYAEGKKDMESYAVTNYYFDKLSILRFPIILGPNDYTKRTIFYSNLISNRLSINPKSIFNEGNYIFSHEAAEAIKNITIDNLSGIFNVCMPSITEDKLISKICKCHNYDKSSLLNSKLEESTTPFTNLFDFKVDSSLYTSIYTLENSYDFCLDRDLKNYL